jgi:hypothetical protein
VSSVPFRDELDAVLARGRLDHREHLEPAFAEFIAANPELLTGDLLDHHFSRATLTGVRQVWVEPDLSALPPVG